MHGIENILMHGMYFQTEAVSQGGQIILQNNKILADVGDIHQHYHSEHILKYALSYLGDIRIEFSTDTADLCKNTDSILTNNSYNSSHKKKPPKIYLCNSII